jgi:iron complex transport system substrate-binding protein
VWGKGQGARDTGRRALFLLALALALGTGTVRAQPAPGRIVSLVPSATEMLFAMGAGSRVVAVGSFDVYPPEVAPLPKVGALLDPNVERILSLRPDLMVCYASQTDLRTQLTRAGIRVFPYRHGSLPDILATMKELGAAIGSPRDGEALALRVSGELTRIRQRVAGRPRPRVMLVIGRETQSLRTLNVSGGYGFLHDLVELAGGQNVFADARRESLNISTETVLARAPQVILELRYTDPPAPDVIARERGTWNALSSVPAVKDGRVILLYGGELVVPGPRVVVTALTFARALHPDRMEW